VSNTRASQIRAILTAHAAGSSSAEEAERAIRQCFEQDLGFARLDTDRAARRGFPEVIYGAGKSKDQLITLIRASATRNPNLLCTRVPEEYGEELSNQLEELTYEPQSRVAYLHREPAPTGQGVVGIVSAGTSDGPVAKEAEICARVMGNRVQVWQDVGVAGLHRLLGVIDEIRQADVLISVAGMEAALPSVLAGLVSRPVISVPTSVGYGASFEGLAALLSSLTACAPGVVTVNIDNGFGAAYAATLMNTPQR
jgi:pyridinium-3,5-biscarboxylic acid mononucleotide synthase